MKHFTIISTLLLTTIGLMAQNVGIQTQTPDSTLSIQNKLLIGGAEGDVVFTDDEGSILFPATTAPNESMIYMFASGTKNADRMVISHSPGLANHGLKFTDIRDAFLFVDNGVTLMSIDYNLNRVGIGVTVPSEYFHIKGVAGQDIRFEGPNNFLDFYSSISTQMNGIRFYENGSFDGGMFYDPINETLSISYSSLNSCVEIDLSSGRRVGLATSISPDYQVSVGGNMNIRSGEEASLTTDGYFQTGLSSGPNLIMDNNEIAARNNGATAPLFLQPNQGKVHIGTTSSWPSTLHVANNSGEAGLRIQINGSTEFLVDSTGAVVVNGFNQKAGYELNVDGQIVAEEVLVQNSLNWPDYVFDKSYNLPSLLEVEEHINSHHHLPNVPSADQIEEDGILLGEMDKTLLRKIEELTLYMIAQSKDIEELKKQNIELKKIITNNEQ